MPVIWLACKIAPVHTVVRRCPVERILVAATAIDPAASTRTESVERLQKTTGSGLSWSAHESSSREPREPALPGVAGCGPCPLSCVALRSV